MSYEKGQNGLDGSCLGEEFAAEVDLGIGVGEGSVAQISSYEIWAEEAPVFEKSPYEAPASEGFAAASRFSDRFCDDVIPLLWSESMLADLLPWPKEQANKYSRGKLVLIAGSDRYPGAACLATRAAQRMGAGYVEVFTTPIARPLVLASCPSAVVRLVSEFDAEALAQTRPDKPCAVAIGPGFDPDDENSERLLARVLKKASCPVLVDGGALAAFKAKRVRKAQAKRYERGYSTVVTPHGGEARRLAEWYGVATDEGPVQLGADLGCAMGAIVVLKGPDTYICSDNNVVFSMREGTAALAKAGTGDVLAGMIASLLAQGLDPKQGAYLGATLHARAGVLGAGRFTDIGVLPEDVIEFIPEAVARMAR